MSAQKDDAFQDMTGDAIAIEKTAQEGAAPSQETTAAAAAKDKGTVRGIVKYPWGIVKGAKVTAGTVSVTSVDTGEYKVSALAPGAYEISAESPFPGYEAQTQKVELVAGEEKVVDIFLDFKKAVVEGHVYNTDGKPIVGAILSGVSSGKDMDTATTDEKGYFRLSKVTPGERFIRVNAPGYTGETRDFETRDDAPTSLEFRLAKAACRIHGAVTDSRSKPLSVEILLLESGIVLQKTRSNSDSGRYEFPVHQGAYQVLATAPGYEPRGWRGSVEADTRVDFNLTRLPETAKEPMYSGRRRTSSPH